MLPEDAHDPPTATVVEELKAVDAAHEGLPISGIVARLVGAPDVRDSAELFNPPRDFPMLVDLYAAGKLNLDDMVTRRYRLEEINDAYHAMLAGELVRGVVVLS